MKISLKNIKATGLVIEAEVSIIDGNKVVFVGQVSAETADKLKLKAKSLLQKAETAASEVTKLVEGEWIPPEPPPLPDPTPEELLSIAIQNARLELDDAFVKAKVDKETRELAKEYPEVKEKLDALDLLTQ